MKETLQKKLHKRKLKPINGALYFVLRIIMFFMNLGIKPSFEFRAEPGKSEGPFVLISNHASRCDYCFTAPACYPKRLNYVVGYNEFFRFPLSLVLKLANAIPKKNFTADMYAVKQMMRIIKAGGNICIMPEGMSSITGMCQPVIPGGGKLLKKLGVDVYYTKISGGYMTFTKHCLDQRNGRTEVVVDKMFTAAELKELSPEQIEDRMNRLLAHDDYIWNKEKQVKFNGKGQMAKNLDTLLYVCPKCGAMYEHECEGNRMRCKKCGNTIEIDECYNIKPIGEDSVCPELVTDWTIMERELAAKKVREPGFKHSEHVKIGMIPKYKHLKHEDTSIICGDGELTLDIDGLHFRGTKFDINGDSDASPSAFEFDINPHELPTYGMCTDISRLYTFVNGEFVEFYFDDGDILWWDHLTEELHRYCGGKWQNTEYRHEA